MAFDFCSLKLILLLWAQFDILLISMLVIFSASRIPSAFTAINRSSAKAIALVCFLNSKLRRELYWIFQNPGLQQDPYGQPLLTSLSTCTVFVLITAVFFTEVAFG